MGVVIYCKFKGAGKVRGWWNGCCKFLRQFCTHHINFEQAGLQMSEIISSYDW